MTFASLAGWVRCWAVAAATLSLMASGLAAAGAAAPAGAAPLPVVTSGGGHSCALMPDQSVWCWGRTTTGQLGGFPAAQRAGGQPRPAPLP